MLRFLTIGLLLALMSVMATANPVVRAQRARIRQGVRSGSLTRAEAVRLRAGMRINPRRNSRAIARLKHNARVR